MEEEEGSEEEEEDMEDDDEELKAISVPVKSSRASSRKSSVSNEASQKQSEGKQRAGLKQLNKDRKKDFKKMKKQRKRADKVAGELSDAFTSAFSGQNDENYDLNPSFMSKREFFTNVKTSPYTAKPKVAFSATLTRETHFGYHEAVKYDRVLTNIGGAYHPWTGHFTVPMDVQQAHNVV
ncbi:uncharacterized protein LOC134268129 [Saccostrea cucullata]|uniref:uncharacterized protein LOC134268129 n=1 Tax=Saccostrea cuccullata TaxID=36930 RepID=UPI002ED49021